MSAAHDARGAGRGARAALLALALTLFPPMTAEAAKIPVPPYGHFVPLRGIRMYYEDRGHGPALLLLHGGTGNGDQFAKQVPAFLTHYRLIVPDSRAQGRTSDGAGPVTYHGMAEDVVALMDHLGIRSARIMGWSDGGVIGLDLAAHHPARVTHLVTFGANTTVEGMNAEDRAWADTATFAAFGDGTRQAWQSLVARRSTRAGEPASPRGSKRGRVPPASNQAVRA